MWYGTWECDSPRIRIDGIDDCQFVGSPDQFQRDGLHFVGAETVELSKSTPQNTAWLEKKRDEKSYPDPVTLLKSYCLLKASVLLNSKCSLYHSISHIIPAT